MSVKKEDAEKADNHTKKDDQEDENDRGTPKQKSTGKEKAKKNLKDKEKPKKKDNKPKPKPQKPSASPTRPVTTVALPVTTKPAKLFHTPVSTKPVVSISPPVALKPIALAVTKPELPVTIPPPSATPITPPDMSKPAVAPEIITLQTVLPEVPPMVPTFRQPSPPPGGFSLESAAAALLVQPAAALVEQPFAINEAAVESSGDGLHHDVEVVESSRNAFTVGPETHKPAQTKGPKASENGITAPEIAGIAACALLVLLLIVGAIRVARNRCRVASAPSTGVEKSKQKYLGSKEHDCIVSFGQEHIPMVSMPTVVVPSASARENVNLNGVPLRSSNWFDFPRHSATTVCSSDVFNLDPVRDSLRRRSSVCDVILNIEQGRPSTYLEISCKNQFWDLETRASTAVSDISSSWTQSQVSSTPNSLLENLALNLQEISASSFNNKVE